MRTTQSDIAKKTGVSKATVSRALRNDVSISKETGERIRRIALELGYRPNVMYESLARHRWAHHHKLHHSTIALIANGFDFRNESASIYMDSIKKQSHSLGLKVELVDMAEVPSHAYALRFLYNRGIKGVILFQDFITPEICELNWESFSLIACGASRIRPNTHAVRLNHDAAFAIPWNNSHSKSNGRIGLVVRSKTTREQFLSERRYRQMQMRRNWKHFVDIPPFDWTKGIADDFKKWIHKYKPKVLIGHDDEIYKELVASGFDIPGEFGYASMQVKEANYGKIAGILDPRPSEARAAVAELHNLIIINEAGIPEQPWTLSMDPKWIDGKSLS